MRGQGTPHVLGWVMGLMSAASMALIPPIFQGITLVILILRIIHRVRHHHVIILTIGKVVKRFLLAIAGRAPELETSFEWTTLTVQAVRHNCTYSIERTHRGITGIFSVKRVRGKD